MLLLFLVIDAIFAELLLSKFNKPQGPRLIPPPPLTPPLPLLTERKGWNDGVSNYSPRYQISTIFLPFF